MASRARTEKASPRIKALGVLLRAPHRYRRLRMFTQSLTLAVLFAVPLSGVVRYDAWRGEHLAWFEPSGGVMAFGWVVVAIVCFYLVTFALNLAFGRVFCGYGCPVGQAARFGDRTEAAERGGTGAKRARAEQVGHALALSCAITLWWVQPAVLWRGSGGEVLAAVGSWFGLALLVVLHGRLFRWRFCRAYCPIGLYYSAVQTNHAFGVHFNPAACENCDMCVRACPVDLDPKQLTAPIEQIGGIAIDGFPGAHHCLTCGDCVQACEYAMNAKQEQLIPLRMSFSAKPEGKRAAN